LGSYTQKTSFFKKSIDQIGRQKQGRGGKRSTGVKYMLIKESLESESQISVGAWREKRELKFKHLPAFEDDVKRRIPDITKITKVFNWRPKVELEEGLKETIKWALK